MGDLPLEFVGVGPREPRRGTADFPNVPDLRLEDWLTP